MEREKAPDPIESAQSHLALLSLGAKGFTAFFDSDEGLEIDLADFIARMGFEQEAYAAVLGILPGHDKADLQVTLSQMVKDIIRDWMRCEKDVMNPFAPIANARMQVEVLQQRKIDPAYAAYIVYDNARVGSRPIEGYESGTDFDPEFARYYLYRVAKERKFPLPALPPVDPDMPRSMADADGLAKLFVAAKLFHDETLTRALASHIYRRMPSEGKAAARMTDRLMRTAPHSLGAISLLDAMSTASLDEGLDEDAPERQLRHSIKQSLRAIPPQNVKGKDAVAILFIVANQGLGNDEAWMRLYQLGRQRDKIVFYEIVRHFSLVFRSLGPLNQFALIKPAFRKACSLFLHLGSESFDHLAFEAFEDFMKRAAQRCAGQDLPMTPEETRYGLLNVENGLVELRRRAKVLELLREIPGHSLRGIPTKQAGPNEIITFAQGQHAFVEVYSLIEGIIATCPRDHFCHTVSNANPDRDRNYLERYLREKGLLQGLVVRVDFKKK